MAPLLDCVGKASFSKDNSNGSAPLLFVTWEEVPFVFGDGARYLLVIISNSSVSVSGD